MGFPKFKFDSNDERLSIFARAIALPVRVSILKILATNKSWVSNDAFDNLILTPITRDRHLRALMDTGLINQIHMKGIVYYKIDRENIQELIESYMLLFDLLKEE